MLCLGVSRHRGFSTSRPDSPHPFPGRERGREKKGSGTDGSASVYSGGVAYASTRRPTRTVFAPRGDASRAAQTLFFSPSRSRARGDLLPFKRVRNSVAHGSLTAQDGCQEGGKHRLTSRARCDTGRKGTSLLLHKPRQAGARKVVLQSRRPTSATAFTRAEGTGPLLHKPRRTGARKVGNSVLPPPRFDTEGGDEPTPTQATPRGPPRQQRCLSFFGRHRPFFSCRPRRRRRRRTGGRAIERASGTGSLARVRLSPREPSFTRSEDRRADTFRVRSTARARARARLTRTLARAVMIESLLGGRVSIMILPQVHLRKPCYDFYFL